MIRKPLGYYAMQQDTIPRLELAHEDLVRVAGLLRSADAPVSTGDLPTGVSKEAGNYSLSGWALHFSREAERLARHRDACAAIVLEQYAEVVAALEDYLDAVPRVVAAMTAVLARYPDAVTDSQRVRMEDRIQLAALIEAELA